MEYLLGPTSTLLIAALLLVVVASFPATTSPSRNAWLPLIVYVGALLGGAALVWLAFDRSPVLSPEFPGRTAVYGIKELEKAQEQNVIVIDGASYVQNGVDDQIVASELKKLGYSAHVVRLAMGAANHFERYHMQETVVKRLRGRASPNQRWLYLTEVQAGYDRIPLAQFDSNQDSLRAYDYTTLQNSWQAARALGTEDVDVPFDGDWRWPLFRHTLINSFSAGAAQRFKPIRNIEMGGGSPASHPAGRFRWRGLSQQIRASKVRPPAPAVLDWLVEIREQRSKRLWRRYAQQLVYFGLPTTALAQLQYVRAFCGAIKQPCLAPADAELLKRLDDRKLWRDPSHLTRRGAIIYSRWLARGLASLNVLQK